MKLGQLIKYTVTTTAIIVTFSLTACNKKGDSSTSGVINGILSCTNCPAGASALGGPYYSSNYSQTMMMTLDVLAFGIAAPGTCPTYANGTPVYPGQCGMTSTSYPGYGYPTGGYGGVYDPVAMYSGQAAIRGTMRITMQDYSSCYAPPGDYAINTLQAGRMYAGAIQGVVLEAVGPVRLILQVGQGAVYKSNPYGGVNDKLNLVMQVMYDNGQNCGTINTY